MKMSISTLLAHHELLRGVPFQPRSASLKIEEDSNRPNGYSFQGFTSHELTVAEKLEELELVLLESKEPVLVIHDIDLDGTVAGVQVMRWLDQSKSPDQRTDVGILHGYGFQGKALEAIEQKDWSAVFILDHSFNEAVYAACQRKTKNVVWVDHHPVPESCKDVEVDTETSIFFITPTFSTAELVWRAVSILYDRRYGNGPCNFYCQETLATTTGHYDTWAWARNKDSKTAQDNHAVWLNDWFSLEPKAKEILYTMLQLQDTDSSTAFYSYYKLLDCGESIDKVRQMINRTVAEEFVGRCTWTFKGEKLRLAYVMHSDSRSMLSDEILSTMSDVDVACVVFYSVRDGRMRFSLRSRPGGPSLSALCEYLGGAGHATAAGFSTTMENTGFYLQDREFKEAE